jgi:hypothetical protein
MMRLRFAVDRSRGQFEMLESIVAALDAESTFWLQGRRYGVGDEGRHALKLIARMAQTSAQQSAKPSCFLPYRTAVRELLKSPPRALLVYVAKETTDPAVRQIAVWLRGRCHGRLGMAAIARLWFDPDVSLRKEVARALKRMEAWGYLREIETSDPNPRVRRLASPPIRRAFANRLADFVASLHRRDVGHPSPLFLSDECDPGGGRPAKPGWIIRRFLEHIRWLVRAPVERGEYGSEPLGPPNC